MGFPRFCWFGLWGGRVVVLVCARGVAGWGFGFTWNCVLAGDFIVGLWIWFLCGWCRLWFCCVCDVNLGGVVWTEWALRVWLAW